MAPDARKKLQQIRLNKKKKAVTHVKDLRQLIKKRGTDNKSGRVSDGVAAGRISKNRPSGSGTRDLRQVNRKLAARVEEVRDKQLINRDSRRLRSAQTTRNVRGKTTTLVKRPINNGGQFKIERRHPEQQYYVPPHIQRSQPTYIIASAPPAPKSKLAMDSVAETQGASVLVSNLIPSITQSEIIELFGDIGIMTAVNMINQTTALVTYQNASDAVRAVKVYHNRLLDDKPMLVNMMPM